MQRSGIREERSVALPDYTAFHPGYGLKIPFEKISFEIDAFPHLGQDTLS